MKRGAQFLGRTGIVIASLIALAISLPAAYAQPKEPEKPGDFKGMGQPAGPADLTTSPAGSLITSPTGPANPPLGFTGSRMVMTQAVWREYVRYLRNDVAIGYGFFMITVDGSSANVKPCKNYACQINPVTQSTALSECQALKKHRCVVFAEGRDIKYAYQVVP